MQQKLWYILGLSFLLFGIFLTIQHNLFEIKGLRLTATISDCRVVSETIAGTDSKTYFYPTLQFKDSEGKEQFQQLPKTTKPYVKGQEVKIIYNPQKPKDIVISTPWTTWWVALIFSIAGLSFLFIGFKNFSNLT